MSSSPWPASVACVKRSAIARATGRSAPWRSAASATSRASLAASASANEAGKSSSSMSLDFMRK